MCQLSCPGRKRERAGGRGKGGGGSGEGGGVGEDALCRVDALGRVLNNVNNVNLCFSCPATL
jgi:hypothetical protein